MATRLPNSAKNAACNAVVDLIDAGAGPGTFQIRTGTQPADPDSAASGTLLATGTFSDPAFGSATAGVATASAIATFAGSANGTAGYFRVLDSNGASVFDGSITSTGGGGDMELSTTTVAIGVDIDITSWTYTQPESE